MSSRLPAALSLALAVTSAQAREATVGIHSPESGAIQTVVTGRGRAASVAMPEGPASMTPRWLIANADLRWSCPDSLAVALRVQTGRGPNTPPRTVALRPVRLQGGATRLELYLWEVAAVKAACTRDGEARVDSVPVQLALQCEQGPEVHSTQTVALQVNCRPSSPSEEESTGLTGYEQSRSQGGIQISLSKFSHLWLEPSVFSLRVGQEQTVTFPSMPLHAWTPRIHLLRVVRLGAGDKVVERHPPLPLTADAFEPRLTFTPRSAGRLRLALEAEYLDGSRLLSRPAELEVLTAKQAADEEARRVPVEKRMAFFDELQKRVEESECGPELVDWIKKQPVIEDASLTTGSSLSYRFTDGRIGIVHCH